MDGERVVLTELVWERWLLPCQRPRRHALTDGQRLAHAVLAQGVADLRGALGHRARRKDILALVAHRDEAIRWFTDESDHGLGSLEHWASVIGLDAAAVRAALRRRGLLPHR